MVGQHFPLKLNVPHLVIEALSQVENYGKIFLKGSSARCSQLILTTHLGLTALSGIFPCHLIQLTSRW